VRAPLTVATAGFLAFTAPVFAQQLDHPRTDYAAYTRPKGVLAAGLPKIEHGIIDEVMVGTYLPPWFLFPVLKAPVPSAYAKFRTPWFDPVTVSLRFGAAYLPEAAVIELSDGSASGSAVSLTADMTASYFIDERFTVSVGVDWAHLQATAEGEETTSMQGASSAHTYSTRAFGEWRLTRTFALSLLTRVLIYQSPVNASATSESDAVSVDAELSGEGTDQRYVTIVPGVSFVFKNWEISGGLGYGVFYLPVLGLASAKAWPVLDFAVAYRFDLYD